MKKLGFFLGLVIGGVTMSHISAMTSPELLKVKVHDYYKKRADGSVGRSLMLSYKGNQSISDAKVQVMANGKQEMFQLNEVSADSIPVLLSPSIGVKQNDTITVSLVWDNTIVSEEVVVPAMRHWTVYIYPHSHVDIGYTNTQENVEFIHKRNLDVAMDLAEKTRNYPKDARFRWNPEVVWPVERYLNSESATKKERLVKAIKRGDISVDASYVNTNTTATNDEELLQLFRFGKNVEKLTGRPVQTMVQTDIPGFSWGVVPAANQMGVKYVLSLFNGSDRVGLAPDFNFHPFWWVGPDGKSKVLYLQPGDYTPGARAKGKYFWPKLAGQIDRDKLFPVVQTDNPRADFIDAYLYDMLPKLEQDEKYPYDIFPMTWCMADNTPIDIDLPEAVKSWNEEYAYPHLKICTATEIMKTFEEKWGDQLPKFSGDFSEYWTDGLGTSAEHTGQSREVKEKLVQSEILWSMLRGNQEEPKDMIQEAWRSMIMGTEHTWAFMDPYRQPIQNNILKTKYGYFEKAKSLTDQLFAMAYEIVEDKTSSQLTVFNTDTWNRTDLVTVSKEVAQKYGKVLDAEGKEVVCQVLSSGELVFMAEDVPALGYRNYQLKAGKTNSTTSQKVTIENTLDNGIVRVVVNPLSGDVCSLIYKGEEFVDSEALVALNSYRYLKGDNSSGHAYKPNNVRIYQGESGPLVNSLIIESDAKGCNSLRSEVSLRKGSAAVDFTNIVDKKDILDKEGVHFGFAFNVPESTTKVNIPWGVFELEKEQLAAANRNWIAMQRWLNIGNERKNVTWCSYNASVFESGDMTANIIGGAFKSPRWIRHLEPSSTIYSWALNNHWHTNFRLSQSGKIKFKYSVLPALGAYNVAASNRFALGQYRPLVGIQTKKNFKMRNPMSVEGTDKVVLTNYKTIEKGKSKVVRLLSYSDQLESIKLSWGKKQPKAMFYVNAGELTPISKDAKIKVPAKAVVSVLVKW